MKNNRLFTAGILNRALKGRRFPSCILSMAALFALVCGMALAGCEADKGSDDPPPKTVAAVYRFTAESGDFTLGETTAVSTEAGNAFSLTGVYTTGGGTFTSANGNGTWAYLYDGEGKRGIVLKYTSGDANETIRAGFGKIEVDGYAGNHDFTFTPALEPGDVSVSPEAGFANGREPPPGQQTVEEKYRFTRESVHFTLGETTCERTGSFSLTGCYTAGGGTVTTSGTNGTWAYLYNGEGKRGVVISLPSSNVIHCYIGTGSIASNTRIAYTFSPPVNESDMSASPSYWAYSR